jgi:uncharacterized protein (TIGR02099 family)
MSDSKESVEEAVAGPTRHASLLLRRTFRIVLAFAIGAYFVAAAALLGLRYVLLPRIDEFRPRIEAAVSQTIHADLRIAKLAPHWSRLEPGIDVSGLTIRDRDGQLALSVPHATATVSWRSLALGKPVLASLIVDEPQVLATRAPDGSLTVAGVPVPTVHRGGDATFSDWLLSQQAIVLRGATLRWRDGLRQAPELTLHNIHAAIFNRGFEHRVALQAPAEGTLLKGPLDFRARFRHTLLAELGKPENWSGEAYVSTGPVDLSTLGRYIAVPMTLYAGSIDNAIWVNFSDGYIRSAHGELDGNDVSLRVRTTQPRLDLKIARFGWAAQIEPQRDYRITLSNLLAEMGQPPLADGTPVTRTLAFSTLSGRYRPPSVENGQLISVSGDRVDLGVLAEFSRALPLPEEFLDELVRFDPRGLMADYTIEVERARPETEPAAREQRVLGTAPIVRYRFKGDLEGISLAAQEPPPGLSRLGHPRAGLPGFENLWGTVDANETGGAVTIDTANAALTFPGEFDDPRLAFDRLAGRAQWSVTPAPGQPHKAFAVTVPELDIENDDLAGSVVAKYTNPGHGRGALDLNATLPRAKVARLTRYFPTSIEEHLRHYLGYGLQGGITRNATIEVHGDLETFPYSQDPHAGVFRIVAPFSGGKYDPSPYPPKKLRNGEPDVWPPLVDIDGVFKLKENVLRFDIDRARYKRVALKHVSGHIADLGNHASSLIIAGQAHGPLADLLDYVNESAAGSMTDHVTEKLRASGPATLDLTLTVPRKQGSHTGVAGTVGFQGNTLGHAGWPPIEDLTGRLNFTEHTLALEDAAGRWLGGKVRADGKLAANGSYALGVSGQLSAARARELDQNSVAGRLLGHLSGEAPFSLDIRGNKSGVPQIAARSDLTGLALDLPAPLGKSSGTPMPFSLTVEPLKGETAEGALGAQTARANLQFGPIAASYLLRREVAGPDAATSAPPFHVVKGAIAVDQAPQLPAAGVTATGALESFDVDAWRTLVAELRDPLAAHAPEVSTGEHTETAGTLSQFVPSSYGLHFDTLKLLERNWTHVGIDAQRTNGDWEAHIAADQLTGSLSWQPGAAGNAGGQLTARFSKAEVPVTVGHALVGQLSSPTTRHMPAIDLAIDDFIVRGRSLGRLAVAAHNVDENGVPVWQVDKFEVTNPAAHLLATANWRTAPRFGTDVPADTPRRTAIDFKLDISDAGAVLEQFGLPRTVKGGAGSLSGRIGWRGEPTAIDYPTLWGHMALDLRHGQFLRVDPGVAKLLGVLSLQSLSRVVTLNFKDVIGEGLPFERTTGTGQIKDGVGRTDNFQIVTAPARADLSGTVDLAAETQDMQVVITPTISAGSAVIAATIVNPLLGLGAFVANLALSQSISHAFATQYAITGSWSRPRIERLSADQGKMSVPTEGTGH